jgi:L-threonylcarbamoyladenylate synthase
MAEPQILAETHPLALSLSKKQVHSGGVIVFPTDTVYGLGCSLFNPESIARLYEIKGRDSAKAIAVMLADTTQISQVAMGLDDRAVRLAERYWPGALTLVVKKHPSIPAVLSSLETVGIRIPDYGFARELIRTVGPMAVTSANLAGLPSGTSIETVLDQLGNQVPLMIDGGPSKGGLASTVVDCTGSTPVVLREGPISAAMIAEVWG